MSEQHAYTYLHPSGPPEFTKYTNTVIGYMLLLIGILIMVAASYHVYQVMVGEREQPVAIFNFSGIKMDLSSMTPKVELPAEVREQAAKLNIKLEGQQQTSEPKMVEIFSAEMINGPANLSAYLFFAGFILNLGAKLGSLGIKLVRPVYVRA